MRIVFRLFLPVFLLVAMIACLAATASARDLYVSNTAGEDTFTGHQPRRLAGGDGPLRTLTRALELARQGDRIVLENTGRPYRESVTLMGRRNSGFSRTRFTIEGNGSTLDGSLPVPVEAWENYRGPVFRFAPRGLTYQQLFLDERPASRVVADPNADGPPELDDLEWCIYGGHIYFRVERLKLPGDYALRYADQRVGITLFHVEGVEIRDLIVQGYQLDGINAHNSARNLSLVNVTCRGNGRAGVSMGGASDGTLLECLVGNNGRAQLLTHPLSVTHVTASHLLSNTAPGWVDRGGRVYLDGEEVRGGLDDPFEVEE